VFFTHCHPQRLIIHKPSFSAALSHNRVPSYLVHAVCALAAPLSKQPRIRTTPARNAGRYFAREALAIMFDSSGRLVCERNLATAQALCLLQTHEFLSKPSWNARYHGMVFLKQSWQFGAEASPLRTRPPNFGTVRCPQT
jgi:hypothetical protein